MTKEKKVSFSHSLGGECLFFLFLQSIIVTQTASSIFESVTKNKNKKTNINNPKTQKKTLKQ